tara:strand:- start:2545 stop:2907 length:363 start_codon:yes stop_codon:yes gene_type:complete
MPINSKQKGNRGEREVVNILNRHLGTKMRRTPLSGAMSFKGDIIDISPDNPLYDFHIEIKNTKTLQIPKWLKQIDDDMPLGKTGLLIYKQKGTWRADITLNDFIGLLLQIKELGELSGGE